MKYVSKMLMLSAALAFVLSACGTTNEGSDKTTTSDKKEESVAKNDSTDTKKTEEKSETTDATSDTESGTEGKDSADDSTAKDSAASTKTDDATSTKTDDSSASSTDEVGKDDSSTTSAEDNATEEKEDQATSSDTTVRVPEKKLTVKENGQAVQKDAMLKESTNQPYSLYVLENYDLLEEEPGKDSIANIKDSHSFMRVEVLPSDVTLEQAEANMKESAEAISSEAKKITDNAQKPAFKDATWYEASTGEDNVRMILIQGKSPLLLSIYTSSANDELPAYLEMAKTIQVK
ncbi:hypothetical protein ACQKJC_16585 [Priestia koreensis]|uniref:hypothetical protein n=1 Tax=Priestia koreensis TaxID=284581 RepID=UPI003CFF86F2